MNTIETIDKLREIMAPVAEKIGQGAAYGWEVVVRQQYMEGVVLLLSGSAAAIGALLGLYLIIKAAKLPRRKKSYSDDTEMTGGAEALVAAGVCLQVLWFAAFGMLSQGLLQVLNPEYYAIDFFINLVR